MKILALFGLLITLSFSGCQSSCCPGECCNENAVCCGNNIKKDESFNRAYDDAVEQQKASEALRGY